MAEVKDILEKYKMSKTAGVATPVAEPTSPIKTASEAGVRDAENLMKVAAAIGDAISDRIVSNLQDFFGGNAEKTASFQNLMADSLVKAAEQVSGTAGYSAVAADQAEHLQLQEVAVHHANTAAQAASDAIQSMADGDEHTAAQQMGVAASNISSAKHFSQRVQAPEVHAHIEQAAAIVAQAAQAAGGE